MFPYFSELFPNIITLSTGEGVRLLVQVDRGKTKLARGQIIAEKGLENQFKNVGKTLLYSSVVVV